MAKTKKIKQQELPKYPKSIETFNEPSLSFLSIREVPSCFNSNVSVVKYRVTIDIVEEPIDVIHSRLQALWDECDNWHHWTPLENAAKEYGYELKGTVGNKRTTLK